MAKLIQAKDENEIKALTLSKLKAEYKKLAGVYNRILEGELVYCHHCNEFLAADTFYSDKKYASGKFPICKKCILQMVEQRTKKSDESNETKDSVKKVLQLMDLPFLEDLYDAQVKIVADESGEKNRKSPFLAYLVPLKSLPQYQGLHWDDSSYKDSDDGTTSSMLGKKAREEAIKRFGNNYNETDLKFLYDEYKDWTQRYECNTKSMELVFQRICSTELEIRRAEKANKPTKDLDKTLQDLMDSGGLKPKQNSLDTLSDAQTFGTLIQKYEETRPLPEIDPELQDVDKIGLYVDSFFRGHASKMLGLTNRFSNLYEKVMSKYTVKRPEYDEETDSEVLFEKIFGSVEDE